MRFFYYKAENIGLYFWKALQYGLRSDVALFLHYAFDRFEFSSILMILV